MDSTPTRRELLQTVGVAATAVAVTGTVSGQRTDGTEWTMFGADRANTGYSPEATGPPETPNALWSVETNAGIEGSAVVVDGRVYVGSTDNWLYAFDADTGDEEWSTETGGEIHSTPAVAGEAGTRTVYVGSDDGRLYAFDADTGEDVPEWSFAIDGRIRASPTVLETAGDSGLVYVGTERDPEGNRLYALDAETGTVEWEQDIGSNISGTPAIVTDDNGATVYVGTETGELLAFDAEDGSAVWDPPFEVGEDLPEAEADLVDFTGAIAATSQAVYAGNRDGHLYALDRDTGQQRWSFDTGGVLVAGPAVTDELVYVGSRNGTVYALDVTDGTEEWAVETGRAINATPTVAGQTVYVGNDAGDLVALDVSTGQEHWLFEFDGAIRAQSAVVDERLYVGDGHGMFSALDSDAEPLDSGADSQAADDEDDDSVLSDLAFLVWPASLLGTVGAILGVLYVAHRSGALERIETVADSYGGDVAEPAPDPEEQSKPTPVWNLVIDDVISRAEKTDTTATDDLLVRKYVDSDSLESPVVAYEIESFRDEPVEIRLTEPLVTEPTDNASKPLGDNWTVEDELVFEGRIGPGETLRTVVGRRDCPAERAGELLDGLTISVES